MVEWGDPTVAHSAISMWKWKGGGTGDLSAGGRHPGQPLDGYFTLQPLHQRHEIPDRENMKLHEIAQSIVRVDCIVKRMVNQRVPKRRDPFLYLLELHLPKQLVAR